MKKIILIIAITGSSSLFAQNIERQVIGSTGGTASSGTIIVTSTVGETAITTETSSSLILTQGFQQANASSTSIEEITAKANYSLFPNPTTDIATLKITAENLNSSATVKIFSIAGKLISTQSLSLSSGVESTLQLDISNRAAGAYIVRITDSSSNLSKTRRLIKQ